MISGREWLEFWASGIPLIDWYYSLKYKSTSVERKLFPKFCARSQKDLIISTAEHLAYFIIGFFAVKVIHAWIAFLIGFFVIFAVVPFEFILYRKKSKLFKGMSDKLLFIITLWNIFNVLFYWIIGMVLGMII